MGRKKDNEFVTERAVAALNAAFTHGMAVQRMNDAAQVANGTGQQLHHLIDELNAVIIVPPKKEMN